MEKDLNPETKSPTDNQTIQENVEIFDVFTGLIELIVEKDLEM